MDEDNTGGISNDASDGLSDQQVALYGSLIIGLGRVYDVLLMIYSNMDQEAAVALRQMHQDGKMWYPPPSYTPED